MRILLSLAVLAAMLTGCRHNEPAPDNSKDTVTMDGFKLWRETIEDDIKKIRQQSAFDLNCTADKLDIHVLSLMTTAGREDWASDIGVTGCGQKARYSRLDAVALGAVGTWVLQSKGAQ